MTSPRTVAPNLASRVLNRPHGNLAVPSILCVFAACLVVSGYWYDPRFLSAGNMISLGQQTSAIGVGALGMTYLIGAGFFDLSGSGIVPLSALALAFFPLGHGSVVLAVLGVVAALLAGLLAGAVNGSLVAYLRIPAFVSTLGSLYVFTSLVELITGGNNIPVNNPIAAALANDTVFQYLPVGVILFLILAGVAHLGLWHTRLGRYVRLLGVNQRSAFVWGIPVQRTIFWGFCISGVMAAVGGLILSGMFSSATASMALNYNLDTIAAVVIGGTRLEGGLASVVGTLVGAAVLAIITNYLTLVGVSPYLQYVIIGVLLVLAVGAGGYDMRRAKRPFLAAGMRMRRKKRNRTAVDSLTAAEPNAADAGAATPAGLAFTSQDSKTAPLLQVRDLGHSYVGVPVLSDVNLEVGAGECLALVGQNGAGKSTIINILSGKVRPATGQLFLRGHETKFASPRMARSCGIAVVAQELELMPTLSVADNIVMGAEPLRWNVLIDEDAREAIAREAIQKTGVHIDIHRRIEELTAGEKQLTEVARGLAAKCNLIILDEPTSSLNAHECERLMAIIEELKRHGCGIIFVSHKFAEIFQVADRLCILRDGTVVGAGTAQELGGAEGVTNLLVGKAIGAQGRAVAMAEPVFPQKSMEKGDDVTNAAIHVRNLRSGNSFLPEFTVRYGEIVGIGGVEGSGGIELMEALAGLREWSADESLVHGRDGCPPTPVDAVRDGIIFLPPDRKEEGIFFDTTVAENIAMGEDIAARHLWGTVWWRRAVELYQDMRERLLIKVQSAVQPCGRLSGGNQQKALFGRAIVSNARVWLLAEPTRGIDVGARAEIYRLMRDETAQGKAIVVRSIDPAELCAVCDRCYVLSPTGRVTELRGPEVTSEEIYAASYDRDDLMLAVAERRGVAV